MSDDTPDPIRRSRPAESLVPIVTLTDPRLAPFRDLRGASARRADRDGELVIVEGRVAVRTLLASSCDVQSVLMDDHQARLARDIVTLATARGAEVLVVERPLLRAIVGFDLHRGVVAAARVPPAPTLSAVLDAGRRSRCLLVAEGICDLENLGALIRTAAAFSCGGLLLDPTTADPWNRRTVRVSSGHLFHLSVSRLHPWPEALATLGAHGFMRVALVTPASARRFEQRGLTHLELTRADVLADAPGTPDAPVALLVGTEGTGLSDAAVDACDVVLSIPLDPRVDSLNVATAAAIACWALRHARA